VTAPLVLASGSPRRIALLKAAGIECETLDPGADGPELGTTPAERVLGHARHKADAGALRRPDCRVLAADTLVWAGSLALPKPRDAAEAEAMLRELEDRSHQVWTGVVLREPDGSVRERADRAQVRVRRYEPGELAAYLDGGEWRDKAGAYGIQGAAGAWATLEEGDVETVIGLRIATVHELLAGSPCSDALDG